MKNSDVKKLRNRDTYCWHCGTNDGLVIHHRMNRGMGGSKHLDKLSNLIMVCHAFNFSMESDAAVATWARDLGMKLSKYDTTAHPVFDNVQKVWFTLDEQGNKIETEPPAYLI